MARRVVKQPNGLLGYFSTIVDDFTYINMTQDEMIEVCREDMGKQEAIDCVNRGISDISIKDKDPDGLGRWKESLKTITLIHGPEKAQKREAECSIPHKSN